MPHESKSKISGQCSATEKKMPELSKTTQRSGSQRQEYNSPLHSSHASPTTYRTPAPKRSSRGSASSFKNGGTSHKDAKPSSEKKPAQSSTPSLDPSHGKVPEAAEYYIPVKVVLQKGYPGCDNEHDSLLNKWQKGSRVQNNSALLTSHMTKGKGKENQSKAKAKESKGKEIELDFLNVLDLNVTGSYLHTLARTYFGRGRSAVSCDMVVDTASSITWVNSVIFRNVAELGTRLGVMVPLSYIGENETVVGELYENAISFGSEHTTIERQVFVVVDETNQPAARKWRVFFGVFGILGLEYKDKALENRREKTPTVSYQLLQKKAPVTILALDFNAPSESDEGIREGSAHGALHFGGFRRSAFDADEPSWVPANMTTWITGLKTFTIKMGMTYRGNDKGDVKVSKKYPAQIDSGSSYLYIPRDMLYDYISTTGKHLFHYDSQLKAHYMYKKDFPKLKDLVLNFDGVDITLPRQAQVVPSRIVQQREPQAFSDHLYLVFRNFPPSTIVDTGPLILLGQSFINRYYIIEDPTSMKAGIAEARHKTYRVWKELREFFPQSMW